MVEFKRKISQELVNDELRIDMYYRVDLKKVSNIEIEGQSLTKKPKAG